MLPLLIAVAQLPPPVVPQGWGVNIHFTDERPGEVAKIAGAFRLVRMDFAWSGIERERGNFDFSAYDRLLASLDREKIRPYFILDYGNDLYGKDSPRTPEGRAAFCRWVAAAMARYRGRGIVWEMWNEPNIGFWKPKPNAEEYILLARAVGETIRRVAPKETFVGPATSGFDWAFLQRCLDAGLIKYWDAVSVHPYRQTEPETAEADWLRLRAMMDRAGGAKKPMLSGEWGYSELFSGQTQARQAQMIARQYLVNLRCGVPISVWYDWRDDGTDPKEAEHHFGTVSPDLSPKPAYLAAQRLSRELAGFSFVTRLHPFDPRSGTDARQWLLLFRKRGDARVVAWTTGAPSEARLPERTVTLGQTPVVLRGDDLDVLLDWPALPWYGMIDGAADALTFFRGPIRRNVGIALGGSGDPSGTAQAILKARGGGGWLLQQTRFVARRPLSLTFVPTRTGGMVARLENPYGQDLRGVQLVVDGKGRPARVGDTPLPQGTRAVGLRASGPGLFAPETVPRFVPLSLKDATATSDGDAKVRASVSVVAAGEGVRLSHDFDPGWRFAELHPADGAVEGRPTALGVWIEGDSSGDLLRMRYTDATGQTFQPDGGAIDWRGWRYVSFPIDGSGGRWGGANDGVVHWPIRIGTVLLVDMPGARGGGQGEIGVERSMLVYGR